MSNFVLPANRQIVEHLPLHISSETAVLKSVILGIGTDQGAPYDINPVAKMHKEQGTYPKEADIIREIAAAKAVLEQAGVQVYQPKNIPHLKQIFTRDIGFVIDDCFVVANMKEKVRQAEINGIEEVLQQIAPTKILELPDEATVEGGDVLVHHQHVFVGISKRTNLAGYEAIKALFPHKKVHAMPLVVSDDPDKNILHLDCAFQPVGKDFAIYYPAGFKEPPTIIHELFAEEHLIKVNLEEKNQMFPNIFSLGPEDVLIEENFTRLIKILEAHDIRCHKVPYSETSKLSGLLRCSTLPLEREKVQ